MEELSPRQQAILSFIRDYTQERGYPPSIREIGKECGISSTSVVKYNLNILKEKRFLERQDDISRGIRLVAPRAFGIPLAGVIVAGEPIPVPESSPFASELIALTESIVPNNQAVEGLYALRVQGDSMIDALVSDGDIVVLAPARGAEILPSREGTDPAPRVEGDDINQIVPDLEEVKRSNLMLSSVKDGEMIAAWLLNEEQTTLKYFYWDRAQKRVRLQPANPAYKPIYVDPANLEIKGKVVAVIRQV